MCKVLILCSVIVYIYSVWYVHGIVVHIDGLGQDCSISNALAMEILQSCTKPSICFQLPMIHVIDIPITQYCFTGISHHWQVDCFFNNLVMPTRKKHQSSWSLALCVKGICQWPVEPPLVLQCGFYVIMRSIAWIYILSAQQSFLPKYRWRNLEEYGFN